MQFSERFELGRFFTFEPSKGNPVYNWFYYKEAYSPEFVSQMLDEFKINGKVLDPFCGVGTTLLASKSKGIFSAGIDSSPLAVFASRVKSADYSEEDLQAVEKSLALMFQEKGYPRLRWVFELFQVEKAFPPANLRDILLMRERLEKAETENARNLLLLALVSILPMCSFVLKDGGVLKIVKKSVAPAKEMFKRKVKRMVKELRESPIQGPLPHISLGDARKMPFEDESFDALITSPPYLNNIDYTKVYGLELSLLEMSFRATAEARKGSLRSFITSKAEAENLPPEIEEIASRIPIAGTYFADMENVLKETKRVLKPGCSSCCVVSNSVIHETHIPVDEILAEIGERLGMEAEIMVGLERTADVRPVKVKTRESAVILRK